MPVKTSSILGEWYKQVINDVCEGSIMGNSVINRRRFLQGLLALGFAPSILASQQNPREFWLSAARSDQADFGMGWVNAALSQSQQLASGYRGHSAAVHPIKANTALLFARRPGNRVIEVNIEQGEITQSFECAQDRHLFGHGCFSIDGSVLFTTENDLTTDDGKIVVRDAGSYQVLDEYPTYGIGPHQLALMPDGKSLAVANGGLLTRPESGRQVLNLASMDSSLAYISVADGSLLEQVRVPETKASIRHLDVGPDGTVAFAMQMQREAAGHPDWVPLTALHRRGSAPRLFAEPNEIITKLRDYVGSVAINPLSRIAGFTSPRGDLAVFWHMDSGEFAGSHRLHDVCGLAVSADQQHFVISSSIGQLRLLDAHTLAENRPLRIETPGQHWDNHLLSAVL